MARVRGKGWREAVRDLPHQGSSVVSKQEETPCSAGEWGLLWLSSTYRHGEPSVQILSSQKKEDAANACSYERQHFTLQYSLHCAVERETLSVGTVPLQQREMDTVLQWKRGHGG